MKLVFVSFFVMSLSFLATAQERGVDPNAPPVREQSISRITQILVHPGGFSVHSGAKTLIFDDGQDSEMNKRCFALALLARDNPSSTLTLLKVDPDTSTGYTGQCGLK